MRWSWTWGLLLAAPASAQDVLHAQGLLHGEPEAGVLHRLPDVPAWIVNGTPAPSADTVVALGLVQEGVFYGVFCSGTVIHPRWVLTAAHCLTEAERQREQGYEIYALFDAHLARDPITSYRATTTLVVHPGFSDQDTTLRDDVGLIRLASSSPAPTQGVLLDDPETYRGEPLTVVGYGFTHTEGGDSGQRRQTTMTFRGCWDPVVRYHGLPCDPGHAPAYEPQILFAVGDDTNVCSGDSGGAVLREMPDGTHLLVGVSSFTVGACEDGRAGSMRIEWFAEWIEEQLDAPLLATTAAAEPTSDAPDEPPLGDGSRTADGTGGSGACDTAPGAPSLWLLWLLGLGIRARRGA